MGEKEVEIYEEYVIPEERGLIETTGRLLGEVLKTPFLKSILRQTLNEIDPKSAPKLVRTIMFEDIEVVLAVAGAIPPIVNTVVEVLKEIGDTLPNVPLGMLGMAAPGLIEDIDIKGLVQGVNSLVQYIAPLIEKYPEILSGIVSDILSTIDGKVLGEMMGSLLTAVIPTILAEGPKIIGDLLSGLLKSMKIGDLLSGLFKSVGIGGLLR